VPSTVDLEFATVEGRLLSLSEFRGKVVMLNFWSTSNAPSAQLVPVLNDLQAAYRGRGVVVIGLSTGDTADKIKQFQNDIPQNYLVGVTRDGMPLKWSISVLPTTYVIDRRGHVTKKLSGVQSREILETTVELALSEGQ
jgi:peroxiredoxin